MNATKYGYAAESVLLPDEDAEVFKELSDKVFEDLAPVGAVEESLTSHVVLLLWRLQRHARIEPAIAAAERYGADARDARNEAARYVEHENPPNMALIDRLLSTVRITNPAAHAAAMKRVREANAAAASFVTDYSRAFCADTTGALDKLHRYERAAERSLIQMLALLNSLQRRRESVK
ncbi:MAG: hypothetical protein M5R36_29590 [Deltaproteobacteria bacterium]|nr:hypothetical protein [Deltaproteobacteria bacterium]